MNDFLDEKRNEIAERLKELKPAVDEYQRLEAAASALDASAPRRRGPGRPPGPATKRPRRTVATATAGKRGGRRKGGGKRATEALTHIQRKPGITIPELATKMGMKKNYLYRVLPGLEQERKITKRDGGWYPEAVG